MPQISLIYDLPFVQATVRANGQTLILNRVLIDTGSGATAFKTEDLERIGFTLDPTDMVKHMVGVGGLESVVEKQVEAVEVGDLAVSPMMIQLGSLSYGFDIDGILGADFLLGAGAVIDFSVLEIRKARR